MRVIRIMTLRMTLQHPRSDGELMQISQSVNLDGLTEEQREAIIASLYLKCVREMDKAIWREEVSKN